MQKGAVITLDFINDLVHADGKLAATAERIAKYQCIERANQLNAWARAQHWPVIHVKVGFSATYVEWPSHSPMFAAAPQKQALILGTWGTEFHDKLQREASDSIVIKHRVNAFHGTDLDVILRAQGVNTVVLLGTSTQMAVESTARDAHDRDYRVMVVHDACQAASQAIHEASLIDLARISRVLSCDEFLNAAGTVG